MPQGVLGFQYEEDAGGSSLTGLAGLPIVLDMAVASGLADAIQSNLKVRRRGDWQDPATVMALVLMNLAGGDCVSDLSTLGADAGLARLITEAGICGVPRAERRQHKLAIRRKLKGGKAKAVPSPSSVFRYLRAFHDEGQEALRQPGKAFIPTPNEHLLGLYRVNASLVAQLQRTNPSAIATLDQDATLVECHKQAALFSYKKFRAYQPLNVWWAEHQAVLHSEFRDGNVPAGYQGLRVLIDALDQLPRGVEQVRYRSDSAGYEVELIRYLAEGRHPRFGRIEFAISADVTAEFRKAALETPDKDWHRLVRTDGDQQIKTEQEFAEVCYVPQWAGYSKNGPPYRFLALREPMQGDLPGIEPAQRELPFQTITTDEGQRYKLFAVVTNRTDVPGDELIWWHRERCGRSEHAHDIMKNDLAGGQLPSDLFGANAAWWAIMLLAFNLLALLKRVALPQQWATKRLKAIRFSVFAIPGRVLTHARRLVVRLANSHPALELLIEARRAILNWARGPTPTASSP